MILLIFSTLALTLISLWLANELLNANKALQEELERNRRLNALYEGKTILSESLDERVKELSDEIEKLEGKNKWLQYELEN